MKCVLVAIGWENIALQALSAMVKENGHEVHLVYDQIYESSVSMNSKNAICGLGQKT